MRVALAVSLASDRRFAASLPFTAYEAPRARPQGFRRTGQV